MEVAVRAIVVAKLREFEFARPVGDRPLAPMTSSLPLVGGLRRSFQESKTPVVRSLGSVKLR